MTWLLLACLGVHGEAGSGSVEAGNWNQLLLPGDCCWGDTAGTTTHREDGVPSRRLPVSLLQPC